MFSFLTIVTIVLCIRVLVRYPGRLGNFRLLGYLIGTRVHDYLRYPVKLIALEEIYFIQKKHWKITEYISFFKHVVKKEAGPTNSTNRTGIQTLGKKGVLKQRK